MSGWFEINPPPSPPPRVLGCVRWLPACLWWGGTSLLAGEKGLTRPGFETGSPSRNTSWEEEGGGGGSRVEGVERRGLFGEITTER